MPGGNYFNSLQSRHGMISSVSSTGSTAVTKTETETKTVEEEPTVSEASPPREPERDFAGTKYIPIYVMLPLGVITEQNTVDNPDKVLQDFKTLKSAKVDGVMVDCWWGLVESEKPQNFNWSGYKHLFSLVKEAGLKLQVVMSFHQCGGNVGDDVNIPLPKWILDIGKSNPDIFFTDKEGRRNPEYLSWGVDKERIFLGRTGLELYFDYMRSFRQELDSFFEDGTITEIEVGLGACGELRYPSYPERHGWKYPGIGEFQCYDKYFQKNLAKAAKHRGHTEWGRAPDGIGEYNSKPQDTDFFRDGGEWDSYYGRFFLRWYAQQLIDHGDRVLSLANLAFEGTPTSAKISGIHWWYKTASHAAELAAGFNNSCHRDGYAAIARMFKKHNTTFNFTCVELRTMEQAKQFPEAMADPEGLVWQVLNSAWEVGIHVASENALPCYDRDGYNKILENSKPRNDPDGHHLAAFTYLRLNPTLMEDCNFKEFTRFVKRLHGEAVDDLQM
ncbi:hypothetical protein GOP47_0002769 [Adiantum capillus-veneris]|uniref:Beta-amylase n=1 Tax=Adiantum capillus-veneris TaxID=13818 RepID=A0A9D4VAP9_ADICA|nr:hypothetical protein GOP47_0002769 [Adiantum capillus-veneris]